MQTTKIERTYYTINEGQNIADKMNPFLDWYQTLDTNTFYTVKELRQMYFVDEAERPFMERAQAAQMGSWMRHLWMANLVERKEVEVERTFTTEGYHEVYSEDAPAKIEVWDACGHKYLIDNPKAKYDFVWGTYTKTVKEHIAYYRRIDDVI